MRFTEDARSPDTVARSIERLLVQVLLKRSRLDAALSRSEPKLKNVLAIAAGAVLRRPDLFTPPGAKIPWDAFSRAMKDARTERGDADKQALDWIRSASVAAEKWLGSASPGHGATPKLPLRGGRSSPGDAFPPAMLQEWSVGWSPRKSDELAGVLSEPSVTTLRVVRRLDRDIVLKRLTEGTPTMPALSKCRSSPLGIRAEGYAPVLSTSAHAEGIFEIQDEGSQVMALFALWPEVFSPLLSQEPGKAAVGESLLRLPRWERDGWTVVDACSGAGGKALAMADLMGGKGRVYGYDVAASKIEALRRRSRRLRLTNVQGVLLPDGGEREALKKFAGTADVVLVDAPCSGWGVLRRNPDIKFGQSAEDRTRLEAIQNRLLGVYSMLVRPGGRLVFGACTFRPEETTAAVERFLREHPEFDAGPSGFFGPSRESDGFYMASMRKVGASQ